MREKVLVAHNIQNYFKKYKIKYVLERVEGVTNLYVGSASLTVFIKV